MVKNTDINEHDIFQFVFFNELLSEEKRKFIEKNEEKFEQLRFYRKQKKSIVGSIKGKTREKIAALIPAYKKFKN
jgi:type III secretory pathway component EscR